MTNPIRHHRKRRGLTLAELGAAIGVSHTSLAYWERGEALPAPEHLNRLADLLGLSSDKLRAELEAFRREYEQRAVAKVTNAAALRR
ncbi:MAG: helix-turn-helix transcriptional regulator [Gemmatimonadota bacterium]|nr:MAG: helix-turn-helix transcriptional regulator [Gemmatimonadota bacterium]